MKYYTSLQTLQNHIQFVKLISFTLKFKIIQTLQKGDMQLNISEAGSTQQNFFFEPIQNKLNDNKQWKEILTKWGLLDTLKIGSFRFNQSFSQFQLESFLKDLFSNPNVRYIINNLKFSNETVTSVKYDKLACTELSTQMFDNLQKNGIVNQNYIAKTFADPYEGIQICDKLRQTLVVEQSETYCTFVEKQRKQLLFKLFQLLVLGGSLNQYEDNLSPYLQWTKTFYKNVVSVRKQAESGNIFVDSIAVEVKNVQKDVFKKQYNPQTVLYVIVCSSTRTVHVVSNQWVKFW